ncbi:MAG: AEC family transporter [Defluviitaleaceae bacterium]|nr:AEC family transporter [Defluviitaleaceae bacterium]
MEFEIMTPLLGGMVTLVVCVMVGYVARRAGMLTDAVNRGLSDILLKVTLPATLFMSMMRPFSAEVLADSALALLVMALVFVMGLVFGFILGKILKAPKSEVRIWQFMLMFPNIVFFGFPIVQSIFGEEGLLYASMGAMVFNIFVFTLGLQLMQPEKSKISIKGLLLNPAIIAMILGITFFVTGLRLPSPLEASAGFFSAATTPVAMLLVGSFLARCIAEHGLIKLINDWRTYIIAATRLIVIPLIAYFAASPFIENQTALGVIITMAAMPIATVTAVFTEQYGTNTWTALKAIVVSDILCLATIPLVWWIIG